MGVFQNSDMFWKAAVPVQADVANFIVRVSQGLQGLAVDPTWVKKLKDRDVEKETANA